MSTVAATATASEWRTGWEDVALSDVAQVVNGGTPKSKVARYWGGAIKWLTPKDMGRMEGRDVATTPRTISQEGLANSSARLVPGNSVILSTRAPIGHLAINTVPMAFNQGCRGIVPGAGLDTTFLYYFLVANKQRLDDLGSGTTFKELSASALKAFRLPLPPLEEQKRIVAVLDQVFAALDRARVNAEANLADAAELKSRTVDYELSVPTLGQLEPVGPQVDLLTGFAFKSGRYSDESSDIRLIRGDNVVQGSFRWDGVKRWPIEDRKTYAKYELALGDVLIAMDRTWVSAGIKYAIVDEAALPSLLVQRVARLRAKRTILPRYLGYWMGSATFEKYVLSIQTGLGVPHVSGKQIEAFSVRVPLIKDQQVVVDRLGSVVETCGNLTVAYTKQLNTLAALRQSLLQKVFSGELT